MSIESSLALALICFIAMVSPGPGILALVAHALAKGFRRSVAMILGMILGDFTFVVLTIAGLAVIARSFETTFIVIRVLAAAYLVYLGIKAWRAGPVDLTRAESIEKSSLRGFISGLLLTLSNPKVIVFYVGVLPGFMDLGSLSPTDAIMAAGIVLGVLVVVLLSYAVAAARARTMLKSERAQKLMNRGSGSVMIGAGITIAVR